MSTPILRFAPLALSCVSLACSALPWPQWDECESAGCGSTSTDSPSETTTPTTGASGVQTVTGDVDEAGSTSSGPGTETSGEPADEPPAIVGFELTPDPIQFNGPITVSATAEHADGIRMQLGAGDPIELDALAPGVFAGEIVIYSGLDNGPRFALLTPWRATTDGETVEAPYTIALPEPGSEGHWETGNTIGQGQIAAMGVLPGGDVIELGTLFTNDGARCYVRRRDKGGAWKMSDVVPIFPGDACSALDLTVDPQGAMFVLVNRKVGNQTRWWLARIPAWQAEPEIVDKGDEAETAVALAAHPSGTVAACLFAPTPALDDDARVRIYRPNLPGETRTFDYQPPDNLPHRFSERTRDCVLAGDVLALVGEMNGKHGMEDKPRNRMFIARIDTNDPGVPVWNVALPDVHTQSGAQAAAVDGLGHLVVAGIVCDDDCQPEGELRTYGLQGDLADVKSLGTFPTEGFAVQDVAWSPAGYAVVATGGEKGSEAAFTVRAFDPEKVEPVWTYVRADGGVLHLALALAIGKYGEVYAGGFGENGYPAVAYIGG